MSLPKQRIEPINYFSIGFVQMFEIELPMLAGLVLVQRVVAMIPEDTGDAFAKDCRRIAKAGADADVVPTGEKNQVAKDADALADIYARHASSPIELLAVATIVLQRAAENLTGSKLPPRLESALKRATAVSVAMGRMTDAIKSAQPRIIRPGDGN